MTIKALLSKLPIAIALITAFTAQGSVQSTQPALTEKQKAWLAKATRHEKGGWIYLHVEGSPREIGFQHGYLLAKEIDECIRATMVDWHHSSSMDWDWLIRHTKSFINRGIRSELKAELEGIAQGMNSAGFHATFDDVIAYNASLETT